MASNTVTINVNANTTQATQGMNNVAGAIINVTQTSLQATSATNQLNNAMNQTRSAVSSITGPLSQLVGLFSAWRAFSFVHDQFSALTKIGAEFERIRYSFDRVVGSSEAAKESMRWVGELGDKSYGIANTTKAFIELASVGIRPTKDQFEGLIGYLFTMGRTGEHELGKVTEQMRTLFQLGSTGMDDALKELNAVIPITIPAVLEKLKIGPVELMREFKKANIDFSTIIQAMFEYMEKRFQKGIEDTEYFWDVLTLKMKAKREKFIAEIAGSGWMQGIIESVSGLLRELDTLESNGTLNEWANQIGQNLKAFVTELGVSDINLKGLGESLVKFSELIKESSDPLRELGKLAVSFATGLGNIAKAISMLPTGSGEGLMYGVLGKYLFGTQAGVLIGSLTVVDRLMDKISSGIPLVNEGNKAMNQISFLDSLNSLAGAFRFGPNMPDPLTNLYSNMQTGVSSGADKLIAEIDESRIKILDALGKQDSAVRDGVKKGHGVSLPGQQMLENQIYDYQLKQKTMMDQMVYTNTTAGLQGIDRWKADHNLRLDKFLEGIEEQKVRLEKLAAMAQEAGDSNLTESVKRGLAELEKQEANYRRLLEDATSKESQKWSNKEASKGVVTGENVDQILARLKMRVAKGQTELADIEKDLERSIATGAGDWLKSQSIEIEKRAQDLVAKIDLQTEQIQLALSEMQQRVMGFGKKPTPEAQGMLAQAKELIEPWNKIVNEFKDKVKATSEQQMQNVEAKHLAEKAASLGKVRFEYSEIASTLEEQLKLNGELIIVEGERTWYQAKEKGAYQEELDLIKKITEEKYRQNELRLSGSGVDGFLEGLRQLRNQMPTAFDEGVSAAKALQNAVNGITDSLVDLAMTGKMSFTNMANSVIKDLLRMMIQSLITNNIMRGIFGMFGITGSVGKAAGLGSIFSKTLHSGGPADPNGGIQRLVDPSVFLFAPRLHNGLAPDEFPAILQKGETVIPKGGELGSNISTAINVTINDSGGGSSMDPGRAESFGKQIGRIVEAEFNRNLQRNLRPGGILNRGLNA